jgi:hypothetical protein
MPIDPVDDPVMPEEPLAAPLPQTGAAENAAEELMRQQSGLFSSMETDPVEPDDDLIVVDDDPEPYLGPPAQNAPPRVRRQEYRRLFANLQRG